VAVGFTPRIWLASRERHFHRNILDQWIALVPADDPTRPRRRLASGGAAWRCPRRSVGRAASASRPAGTVTAAADVRRGGRRPSDTASLRKLARDANDNVKERDRR
jgi:hypothetical protein